MRVAPLWLWAFLTFSLQSSQQINQKEQGRPSYMSESQAKKYADTTLEAPIEYRKQVNLAQMREESLELRRLAEAIPEQVQGAGGGKLPKDLGENLKRIEKLAKHLRSEVTP